jgi:hypothetical protein
MTVVVWQLAASASGLRLGRQTVPTPRWDVFQRVAHFTTALPSRRTSDPPFDCQLGGCPHRESSLWCPP